MKEARRKVVLVVDIVWSTCAGDPIMAGARYTVVGGGRKMENTLDEKEKSERVSKRQEVKGLNTTGWQLELHGSMTGRIDASILCDAKVLFLVV